MAKLLEKGFFQKQKLSPVSFWRCFEYLIFREGGWVQIWLASDSLPCYNSSLCKKVKTALFLPDFWYFWSRYDPQRSIVELSPVRLYIHLVFPAENDNTFTLDLELKGVVAVEESKASMLGTKLEVKMKKAESSSWAKLDIPRVVKKEEKKAEEEAQTLLDMAKKEPVVDALDLDDLDITPQKFVLSKEAKTKAAY